MAEILPDHLLFELDPDSRIVSIASWLEPLLGGNTMVTGSFLSPGWLSPQEWKRLLQMLEGAQADLLLTRADGVGIAAVVRVTARQDGPGLALSLVPLRPAPAHVPYARYQSFRSIWCWDLQHDAIVERDGQGLIQAWNGAAERLFGIAAAAALGQSRFELIRSELPLPLPEIDAYVGQNGTWTATLTHRHPDGSVLRTTAQWVLCRNGSATEPGVTEIYRDLGDPELAMREARYFAEVHSALFESETARQLAERCLPLFARHYGWQAAELWLFDTANLPGSGASSARPSCTLTGRWLAPENLDDQRYLPFHPDGVTSLTRSDFPPQPRWSNISPGSHAGAPPWRTVLTIPLRSATHEMGALVLYATSSRPESPQIITQLAQTGVQLGQWFHRHAAEDHLRRSEERFRALMESAPDAIVITDDRGLITMANLQTERLFGWRRQLLIGQPIEMLMPMRFRTRHLQHRDHYAGQPHARPMGAGLELAALRADGSEFPVEISLSPIQIDNQTMVAAAIRDASERREMERTQRRLHQLEMAQAEHLASVGQLAAGMAHEIKNPLAGMSAALEVLAGEKELSPAAAEIMGEVLHQATRIRKIVDELLNYARPRPAQLILTDLNTTVEQSIPFAAIQAQARGVKVQFKPVPLPLVLHDPEQIHRLVLNLLMNAIDASSAGGTVELNTARKSHGHAITVTVSDHGCGIAEEDLARIFVPFFTTKGSRGTGLGLSLCRRIAELHDGSLTAASTPGKGSRFTLTLPIKDASVPETPSGAHLGQTKDPHRG